MSKHHKSATDTNHGVTMKARTQECGMECGREIIYRKLENNKQASKSVIRKYRHMMYIWARASLGLTTFFFFSSSTVLTFMPINQVRLEVHPSPWNQLHTISVCDCSVDWTKPGLNFVGLFLPRSISWSLCYIKIDIHTSVPCSVPYSCIPTLTVTPNHGQCATY